MPLSKYYGGGHGSEIMKAMNKNKKHEKFESKKTEKMETGPSSKIRRKHGV